MSLKLNIAATDIALAEQAGLWTDKLDIFLVQRDDAMLHAKLEGQTLGLRLKPFTYQQVLRDGINIDEPIKSLRERGTSRCGRRREHRPHRNSHAPGYFFESKVNCSDVGRISFSQKIPAQNKAAQRAASRELRRRSA